MTDLVDLLVGPEAATELQRASPRWPSCTLTPRQLCDLELLATGAFSPLRGFMGRADFESVCRRMRLADDRLWPIPIMLDAPDALAERLEPGARLGLRAPDGTLLAALHVEDVWRHEPDIEAELVYGTSRPEHPGVAAVLDAQPWLVGGALEVIRLPAHYDFPSLRFTPRQLRQAFHERGWDRIVAFQTRNPLHRAHYELTRRAMHEARARLVIHPAVGLTKRGDVDHYTRVRCYTAVLDRYPADTAMLALLPLAMRMAGPREALWHAIVRQNHGFTHFIVGRDHAGPGVDADGRPFYDPYAAQELCARHASELDIAIVPSRDLVYVKEADAYLPDDAVPAGTTPLRLSGTDLRKRLADADELPAWFTFPEVARELQPHPGRARDGCTVFLTGLPAAGKSTIASALEARLLERGRTVTLLDGDLVRTMLSAGLGFSREDRDANIRRIGFVATEVTRHGGIALCAPIAPYDAVRREVRRSVEAVGGFVLVHVATPLATCEERDPKGLYAKARSGEIQSFTGISDPYEAPADAEVVVDTAVDTIADATDRILSALADRGYL